MFNLLTANAVSERLSKVLSPDKVSLFGTKIMVNPSFYSGFVVMLVLVILAIILRLTVIRRLKNVPGPVQKILEMFVGGFHKIAEGKYSNFIGCYIMIAAVYIGLGTLIELLGFRPIMSDLNACLSMGISTFILINFYGFREKGAKRLKRFLNPINIITDVAVPISMSFRLFGSIVSGFLIMELIYSYLLTSFVVPVLVSVITTLFHAFIQAYIFATLSSLFIYEATE